MYWFIATSIIHRPSWMDIYNCSRWCCVSEPAEPDFEIQVMAKISDSIVLPHVRNLLLYHYIGKWWRHSSLYMVHSTPYAGCLCVYIINTLSETSCSLSFHNRLVTDNESARDENQTKSMARVLSDVFLGQSNRFDVMKTLLQVGHQHLLINEFTPQNRS